MLIAKLTVLLAYSIATQRSQRRTDGPSSGMPLARTFKNSSRSRSAALAGGGSRSLHTRVAGAQAALYGTKGLPAHPVNRKTCWMALTDHVRTHVRTYFLVMAVQAGKIDAAHPALVQLLAALQPSLPIDVLPTAGGHLDALALCSQV